MSNESNNDGPFNLPQASLKLDPTTVKLIDSSKVKRFIGPLIIKAQKAGARRVAVLSWNDEDSARRVAQILTIAMAQQLDRKCALVVAEGLRISCDNYDCFSLVTVPEVELSENAENMRNLSKDLDANFPFQFFPGPALESVSLSEPVDAKTKIALGLEGKVLVVPSTGLPRNAVRELAELTQRENIRWLGVVVLDEIGGFHESH